MSKETLGRRKTLFVGFTDLEGAPVTDITAEDVAILWDDVACEILELEPVNWPVRVTVYVDNATESVSALPDMREGVKLFLDALPPDIEVAIASLSGRPQFRSPYTTDRGELTDALGQIASEGGSAAFFDALHEAAKRMHEDEDRHYTPVIVMVAVAGSEGSGRVQSGRFERMMDRLYANAATVHTLLFRAPYGVGKQMGHSQARWGTTSPRRPTVGSNRSWLLLRTARCCQNSPRTSPGRTSWSAISTG